MNPYKEVLQGNISDRVFSVDTPEEEFVWHRDLEDRLIIVLEPNGWMFQYDNELPIAFEKDKEYFVPKNSYHRVIRGFGDLSIRIHKY